GTDYTPNLWNASRYLPCFRPGHTTLRLWIKTWNDAHDDPGETFEMVLSNPRGATIDDAVAVGTINNDDPLPGAYLARFGRAAAEHALGGVAGRMEAGRTPGLRGAFAGRPFGRTAGAGEEAASGAAVPAAAGAVVMGHGTAPSAARGSGGFRAPDDPGGSPFNGGLAGGGALGHGAASGGGFGAVPPSAMPPAMRPGGGPAGAGPSMTIGDALLGSSFTLTRAADGSGGSLAFWGRASRSRFGGADRSGGTEAALDGEAATAMLGADYARGGWLAGLALIESASKGGYRALVGNNPCAGPGPGSAGGAGAAPPAPCAPAGLGEGEVEASLTAAVPYASLRLGERFRLWGAAGHGAGGVSLRTMGETYSADTSWGMAAAGLRGGLLGAGGGGPSLSVVSDALWTRTASAAGRGLAASESASTRLRIGLEGSWRLALPGGGSLAPRLELGARHDGGDAETGFGVELGGGFKWAEPRLGLSLDISGRTLLAHEDGGIRDRGLSAALSFDPAPSTELGPSLSLRQDLGGRASGGLDALFRPGPMEARAGGGAAAGRWALEAAWGLPAFGGRFIGVPLLGFGQAPGGRDHSLGWRLSPKDGDAPDLSLGVLAVRRESARAGADHGIEIKLGYRW
ncbi:MAG: hypothetical protein OXF66_00445, partial [Gammaproteobacteria bacterium]|nr:hypothetical protein [Gammaproteobacteria bacterium]